MQEAQKVGCLDADALYQLVDLKNVNIGEDFSFNQDELKTVITEAQKNRSYLFKKDAAAPKDATPTNKQQTSTTNLMEMKPEQLQELLAKKLAQ